MTALIVIAVTVGAVVAFSAIAEATRRMRKAARPDDLEALADATREVPPRTGEQIERLRQAIEDGEL